MKKSIILGLLCLSNSLVVLGQGKWMVDKGHSKLAFSVIHLAISEVDGSFKKFDASIIATKEDFSDAIFELTADVASVSTDNEMRDNDLKKPNNFDVIQFPTMSFKSTDIKKTKDKTFQLTGDLTLKGVTKPITLELIHLGSTTNRQGKKLAGFKVNGIIKRSEFGVGSMPALVASEEITLRASGEFILNDLN